MIAKLDNITKQGTYTKKTHKQWEQQKTMNKQQQSHRLRTERRRSRLVALINFKLPNYSPCKTQNQFRWRWGFLTYATYHHRETTKSINILWWNKENGSQPQTVWAKKKTVEPRWAHHRQTSGNDPLMKVSVCQCRHWVWCLAHRRVIKEETIAINRDWLYNQAMPCRCRLKYETCAPLHRFHITYIS